MTIIIKKIEKSFRLRAEGRCYDTYYILENEKRCYEFSEPIPNRLKIITLKIIEKLPREIKEKILNNLIIGTIRDIYTYQQIAYYMNEENNDLYYKEKYGEL